MPQSSSWALHQSIYQRLAADAGVVMLLGGTRIYDHVPRNASYPYVTFGQSIAREYGTAIDDGEEHILTLHVWSDGGSRGQAHEIMGAVRRALHDEPLSLTDHRLVNISQEFADARREPERETYHGIIRYRAVTEPAN
jgi:hypothetical protein